MKIIGGSFDGSKRGGLGHIEEVVRYYVDGGRHGGLILEWEWHQVGCF